MATTIQIDPVTRIEGHMKVEVTVDAVGGVQQIVDARSSGTMFRGFERILQGRDPRDAVHYTQRICGVCPVSHGMASSLALESTFGVTPPTNGRILRNLVLGADFLHSHILHFYHLAAPDYIDTTGLLDLSPWTPRYTTADMVNGPVAASLVSHYVTALAMRRKAHEMGAIFGGKLPCAPTFIAGGNTEVVTAEKVTQFRALLTELRGFIDNVFVPDVAAVGERFAPYYEIGAGCGNLLAYGVFDLNATGTNKLLARGRYTGGAAATVNVAEITEYVGHSYYTPSSGGLNPSVGITEPDPYKATGYSWIKAPRYANDPHELGPLARMYVNGDYTRGISVMDRLAARALETQKIANAMNTWLDELTPGGAVYASNTVPLSGSGVGLTEAPRGALGHWVSVANSSIARYQVITPTAWNASPRDDVDRPGPIEQALIGTPIADPAQPIEALRVVHSFDPCLACSVHLLRPAKRGARRSRPATTAT